MIRRNEALDVFRKRYRGQFECFEVIHRIKGDIESFTPQPFVLYGSHISVCVQPYSTNTTQNALSPPRTLRALDYTNHAHAHVHDTRAANFLLLRKSFSIETLCFLRI
jgi:hypothetical protein